VKKDNLLKEKTMAEEKTIVTIEDYYKEQDPDRRCQVLDDLLNQDPSPENQKRKEIFDLRYKKTKINGGRLADGYIGLWMTMKLHADRTGIFGYRSAAKEIKKMLSKMGIDQLMAQGEDVQELLYQEFYHMASIFIQSGMDDRHYGTALFGLVNLSDNQVKDKLLKDVYNIAYMLPEKMKMTKELALFTKATKCAFDQILPDCRQDLDKMVK
jgi:hypothetical protein